MKYFIIYRGIVGMYCFDTDCYIGNSVSYFYVNRDRRIQLLPV